MIESSTRGAATTNKQTNETRLLTTLDFDPDLLINIQNIHFDMPITYSYMLIMNSYENKQYLFYIYFLIEVKHKPLT